MAGSRLQRRKVELLLDTVERLPTLPGVARRLLALLVSDNPSTREIQQAIESDATLAARVLSLAARASDAGRYVTTIQAALKAVGLQEVFADLLSVSILDTEVLRRAKLVRLWRHNLATGMAAQIIAARLGTVSPDEALLAALVHDIGHVALASLMPKAFGQVFEHIEATGADLLEAERDLLSVDHAVIGRQLALRWGFPPALQNVIWLHHQANVPAPEENGAARLIQVVRLADLIARQEGFGYHPSEQVRDNTAEVAERLGLSGAGAEEIGQRVADAVELNARAIGMEDEPTPGQLWRLVVAANERLGTFYRTASDRRRELQVHTHRADLLIQLNGRLAACRSSREVLETVADTAREVLGLRTVVAYLLARNFDYIEGVRCTAERGIEDRFLYEVPESQTLETLLADRSGPAGAVLVPVRAERAESWLFERAGERLGPGPFYTIPMIVENVKVGGMVFTLPARRTDLEPYETAELVALANLAGVAVKRAQAEADLIALSEELAEANRELALAQETRLQERNVAALSEMAAGAAHEINNPLAVISGRAQQLVGGEKDTARRDMLQSIIEQTERASDIIRELRQFARPPRPQPQAVDAAALAKAVADEFQDQLKGSPVTLRVESPQAVPPIRVDAEQVRDALREVVRNAVEACAQGGHVTVMVRPLAVEAAVRIAVADDGPGMEPQVRARAFDPFYSGYEAGRHRGLGLPKAFRAVQANGGQMALESTPGQGTTVRMTFPAAEAETPA